MRAPHASRLTPHVLALALLFMLAVARAAELTPEQDVRYQALLAELRCLVCQNQTLLESTAPLAQDLRNQVRSQMAAGKSDDEIKQYLTARYGDFVLYRPPFKLKTWLLWLGPFALLLIAAAVAVVYARRHRRAAAPPAVDESKLKRLLDEES